MNSILALVGEGALRAIPTIILVTLLYFVLKRLFFGSLESVLKRRQDASLGARERARQQLALVETKTQEYEAAWQREREGVYRARQAERDQAAEARDEVVRQARVRAEEQVKQAQATLAALVDKLRAELSGAGQALAEEIAGVVLRPARRADQ